MTKIIFLIYMFCNIIKSSSCTVFQLVINLCVNSFVTPPAVSSVKSGQAKKHVFGSSGDCRGGGCQTLARALGVLAYGWRLLP